MFLMEHTCVDDSDSEFQKYKPFLEHKIDSISVLSKLLMIKQPECSREFPCKGLGRVNKRRIEMRGLGPKGLFGPRPSLWFRMHLPLSCLPLATWKLNFWKLSHKSEFRRKFFKEYSDSFSASAK